MRNIESQNIVDELLTIISEKRRELGISHEAVARRAGLHRSTISLIERGLRVPTIYTCLVICKALGISLVDTLIEAEKRAQKKKEQTS